MPEFQESDRAAIVDFIRRHPLATLMGTSDDGKLVATHVPLLIDDDGSELILRGHVMRKTEHWHGYKANSEVLVAFTGPDGPVPAGWYVDTNNGGTWNYMAAHLRGSLRFLPQVELVEILRELKNQFEPEPTAKFENLSAEYVPSLIKAIEGFEIRVDSLNAVFKLSQNRDDVDFERVVSRLDAQGGKSALLADEMRTQRSRMGAVKV